MTDTPPDLSEAEPILRSIIEFVDEALEAAQVEAQNARRYRDDSKYSTAFDKLVRKRIADASIEHAADWWPSDLESRPLEDACGEAPREHHEGARAESSEDRDVALGPDEDAGKGHKKENHHRAFESKLLGPEFDVHLGAAPSVRVGSGVRIAATAES